MMSSCYCGSSLPYEQCCRVYHLNFNAPTALALMKSRYSAFCKADINYIQQTMCGKALKNFDMVSLAQWARSVHWLSLQITYSDESSVEFIARYLEGETVKVIHELSSFEHIDNQWFYTSGLPPKHHKAVTDRKIGRNELCPCGSGKKFKRCDHKPKPSN